MSYLKWSNSETESSMVVTRDLGGREGSYLMGAEFQFGKKKTFWRWILVIVS